MSTSLEERLKAHSSAFDGLLSLIPAKYYYDDATQDQWQQKKKSKEEQKENKKRKFDPDAKEEADDYSNSYASAQDVKENNEINAKRIKLPERNTIVARPEHKEPDGTEGQAVVKNTGEESGPDKNDDFSITEDASLVFDDEGNEIADKTESVHLKKKQPLKSDKKTVTPEDESKKKEGLKKLSDRLSEKISTLRAKRKAVGSNAQGAPKSRDQILAERKRKEELKKEEKKRIKEEAQEQSASESESDSDDADHDESEEEEKVFFGNIEFADGSKATSDLNRFRLGLENRRKGPANNDIKAHLLKLEQRKRKLDQKSPEEQNKEREKQQWNKVISQAEGIKIKDDEKLLKKALKRKEHQKLKSELEWRDRKQLVKDTIAAKDKRREENLKARKANKGKKGKKQQKLKKFSGVVNNKKKRAGFEGSAKSKGKHRK